MILSELQIDKSVRKTGKIVITQRCDAKCDICGKEYNSIYLNILKGRDKYNKDLCRSCKMKEEYKRKERKAIGWGHWNNGKTLEEKLGKERADKIKAKMSIRSSGSNNPNYGNPYGFQKGYISKNTGKTLEEIHGIEKAKEIRIKLSKANSGSNNNMFGKPSPKGSGNGWSGWYKGWYFRSITELSYMINIIEGNNLIWENGEQKKYKIPYLLDGRERNYFSDFIVDKVMIEVKPKNLKNSELVLLKEEAAIKWCKERNMEYKIVSDNEFNRLNKEEIKALHDEGIIKFIDRYEEKYRSL